LAVFSPYEAAFDPDNGYIYVANLGGGVSVIDGSKNTVITTIPASSPVQLVYNPSNKYTYTAGHNSNTLSIIDTRTNTLIGTLTGFQDPTGVGYNSANGNIYVGNQGTNYVSILSGSTNNACNLLRICEYLYKKHVKVSTKTYIWD